MITDKHVVRVLHTHAKLCVKLSDDIQSGVDLKDVMDKFFAENARTYNLLSAFDTQECLAAAPAALGIVRKDG